MSFSDFLQEKLGHHDPGQIQELILDGIFGEKSKIKSLSADHKAALEKYSKLIHLSLNNLGIENLENLPSLPELQVLQLTDNNLTGKDLEVLPKLYHLLYKVKLSRNKIASKDVFKALEGSNISKIEVKDNPFSTNNPKYKEELFEMLPKLKIVDKIDKNGNEIDTTDYEEGEEQDDGEEDLEDEEFEEEDEDDGEEDFEDEEDEEEEEETDGKRKKSKHK